MGVCKFSNHHLLVFLNNGGKVGYERRCPDLFFRIPMSIVRHRFAGLDFLRKLKIYVLLKAWFPYKLFRVYCTFLRALSGSGDSKKMGTQFWTRNCRHYQGLDVDKAVKAHKEPPPPPPLLA